MRLGKQFPDDLWQQLQSRFAVDAAPGVQDPRFEEVKFREGYGMSIYWASLGRMMCRRALLDASTLGELLVLLQAADSCAELPEKRALQFLSRPNPYRTGHVHGTLPCHVGMQVRLIAKLDSEKGMIQDTVGIIVRFEFHRSDREAYSRCSGGELFSPWYLPSGLWLSVDGYQGCTNWEELMKLCLQHVSDEAAAEKLPRCLWFLPAEEIVVKFASGENYTVKRCGFRVTHANFLYQYWFAGSDTAERHCG
eukprot:s3207_g8.t1